MHRFLPSLVVAGAMMTASPAFSQTTGPSARDQSSADAASSGASAFMHGQDLLPSLATGKRGVQVRTNLFSGGNLQAGSVVDYFPNPAHPETPGIAARRDMSAPVQLGAFVGYLFHDEGTAGTSSTVGLDVHVATDPLAQNSGWLLQPGLGYTTPLTPSWQLNTRLFSTYAPEKSGPAPLGSDGAATMRLGNSSEPGFQDVGIGLGLGYSITDSWNIQTQARYQRMFGVGETDGDKETSPNQFFGGVMIDYKF